MAMAAALPAPRPHAAAATETRVRILGKETIYVDHKPRGHLCSVRLHGDLVLSHGSCRAVTVRELDHRVEVAHVATFTCVEVCSELIHNMLAEAPATREYDLAAGNWVDSIHTPLDIAEEIAGYVRVEFDDDMGVPAPGLEFDIHLPELRVTLVYRCAICWLDSDTKGEGTVTLPCFHLFHTRCIAPWFHEASTCPTCRQEILEPFSFVRSASPEHEDDVLFDDESEDGDEDDVLFDDESEDEPFLDDRAEVHEHHTDFLAQYA